MREETSFGDRYYLEKKIGQGGMGAVFRALDLESGRMVALKLLHESLGTEPTFIARFRQEARAAASLSHPHIVKVHDYGRAAGHYYIAMEYVEGMDLKRRLSTTGPLPPAEAVAIARQICAGLQAAHARGLVHRDLKPQNILLTREGQAKIADFGLARAASATGLSVTGTLVGSAHYFSPEQARGEPATEVSDLYSIGVILYEMLTGRLPFEADNVWAMVRMHAEQQAPSPRQYAPHIPPPLAALVLRALEKSPARRYASAAELAEALEGVDITPVPVADGTAEARAPRRFSLRVPALSPRTPALVGASLFGLMLYSLFAMILVPLGLDALESVPSMLPQIGTAATGSQPGTISSQPAPEESSLRWSIAWPVRGEARLKILEGHVGLEISKPQEDLVRAVDAGRVVFSGQHTDYGQVVILQHANGYQSLYANLLTTRVRIGQSVLQGEVIGTLEPRRGKLRFEILDRTAGANPMAFLQGAPRLDPLPFLTEGESS